MRPDVLDIRDFYETRQGCITARLISEKISQLMPNVAGQRILGFGYTLPYLEAFGDEAELTFSLMHEAQGAVPWPRNEKSRVTLCRGSQLPLPDQSVDYVILVHAVEFMNQSQTLLREVWRVLAGEGRVICVVPNRNGLWARHEQTPFSTGHPYSRRQIESTLKQNMFMPLSCKKALFMPPTRSRGMLKTATAWEHISERWFNQLPGVYICEASKKIYSGLGPTPVNRRRHAKPIPTTNFRSE